jgi:hypothetical protein
MNSTISYKKTFRRRLKTKNFKHIFALKTKKYEHNITGALKIFENRQQNLQVEYYISSCETIFLKGQ